MGGLFGGNKRPAITPATPPAAVPTRADASVIQAGQRAARGPGGSRASLINTGSTGLSTKAKTGRRSLLGGGT